MKRGLKGGISIHADSGPPRYVLWCCGGICHEVLTFIQIGCGHTVYRNGSSTYHAALSFAIGSISKVSRKPSNFVLFTVIRCGYPGHLLNGHVIGRSYLFGDVIHYSCHEGYKLQGSKSRQCNEHGFWTGVRPACRGKRQLYI